MAKKEIEKLSAPKKLKALITIIDRRKVDFYVSAIEGYGANVQYIIYGRGTYLDSNNTATYNDKAILVSLINEEYANDILTSMEEKYFKTRYGKGIAFVVPLSSLVGILTYRLLSNTING